jgi:hypothetical protein
MKKGKSPTVQTAVRLPRDMHERLKQSEAGVSEEIRRCVQRAFDMDALDPDTRELAADMLELAELVRFDVAGNWNSHPGAHAAFRAAVIALIDERKPKGAPIFGAARDLLGAGISKSDDPDTIGRALVRHYHRVKAERKKLLQELLNRQKEKGEGS